MTLIDFGADVNLVNTEGEYALTLATKSNLVEVVWQIVEKPSFNTELLDCTSASAGSPLMIANFRGHFEVARILLGAGARVNVSSFSDYHSLQLPPQEIKLSTDTDDIKGSALDIAVIQGNTEMVSLLLEYKPRVHNIYYLFRSIVLKQVRYYNQHSANHFFKSVLIQESNTAHESTKSDMP